MYPVLIIILLLIILVSIFYSYKNLYFNKKPSLCIFAFIPLFVLLFGESYEKTFIVPLDDYHFGEQFAAFFLHKKYGMLYYKDIMLMHGLNDIVPSWLGHYVFHSDTIYSALQGGVLYNNIIFIISIILGYSIFKKFPVFLSFILCKPFMFINICCLGFLALLNKILIKKVFLWLLLYIIYVYSITLFRTTFGKFAFIASLPAAIYMAKKLIKNNILFTYNFCLNFFLQI